MMRNLFVALCMLLGALFQSALAQSSAMTRQEALAALSSREPEVRREALRSLAAVGEMADLPQLIAALHDDDGVARDLAEQAAWQVWSRSGDAQIDELFQLGLRQMGTNPEAAVATFSEIIERMPAFAEGWNKRATLYFMLGDYERSLADCDEVMKRNPNHFGALAGYGQIYVRLEEYELALDYLRRALAINPNMPAVREIARQLEQFIGKPVPKRFILRQLERQST